MLQEKYENRVKEVLKKLLANPKEELRRLNIKGIRRDATCCPIANYLKLHLQNCCAICIGAVSIKVKFSTVIVEIPTEQSLKEFMYNFDKGIYPDFEEGVYLNFEDT